MTSITDILVATDFSDNGRDAADRAALLAAAHRAQLRLLHVMNGPSLASLGELFASPEEAEHRLMEEARRLLQALAGELERAHGVAADVRVRIGRVVEEILAEAGPADLLVLGARGLNTLRDLILGSTADRLLRKRRQPSLVVRCAAQSAYRRVLVPVDFSSGSAEALRLAMSVAPDAEYWVFHAYDIPLEGSLRLAGVSRERLDEHRERARLAALRALGGLIQAADDGRHRFTPVARSGEAALLILNEASAIEVDLIVMGKHDRSRIEELFLGSTARHVLAAATCDVLVI